MTKNNNLTTGEKIIYKQINLIKKEITNYNDDIAARVTMIAILIFLLFITDLVILCNI